MNNFFLASLVLLFASMQACNGRSAGSAWRAGGLYSIEEKDHFGVVKILVLEPDVVHVRVYKQKFSMRPTSVDPSLLTIGKLGDKDGFSAGHLPLSPKTFASWNPVFISQQGVAESELEGYEIWKNAKGGVF